MKHMERYLAATSGKNRENEISSDLSAADSQDAIKDQCDTLTGHLNKITLKNRNQGKNDVLNQISSHAVNGIADRQSTATFSTEVSDFASSDRAVYDGATVYDEVTVIEEEVIEEVMEEEEVTEEEDDDYAWDGSGHGSERSRLSQRFPARSFRKSMDGSDSIASSVMYEEETVYTNALESERSRMSIYDEQTVAETVMEEVTVVEGSMDDVDQDGEDSKSHDSALDSDDGMPEDDDDDEEDEENESEGFTLAFKRNSANQARVSDITLDHSSWAHEMDGEFEDDVNHIPGQGEEGYCVQFKEGNFRSSIASHAPSPMTTATRKSTNFLPSNKFPVPTSNNFGVPSINKFLPSNKASSTTASRVSITKPFGNKPITAPRVSITKPFGNKPITAPRVSITKPFGNKAITAPRVSTTPPRVSIMKQFANKPLPALTEVSARKERGEKKKKKLKSFDGAGEKKELFMFWERKSTGESTPLAEEAKTATAEVT